MNYTNSSLITCKKLSPNFTSGRTTINRITIHHTATGAISAARIGEIFANKSRNASCNYGIGDDGSICLIVEEKNRAWTSSNKTNDMSAITFEVSDHAYGEPWAVSDKAYESMINLCADICQRYGIKEVFNIQSEIAKLPQNKRAAFANNYVVPKGKLLLTQHNYFSSTACPGSTLKTNWDKITADINAKIGHVPTPEPEPESEFPYLVKITASVLNVRKGPGTSYPVATTVKKGQIYTIIDESNGWGKLISGAGWICLDYTTKMQ